jgi:hypothetical protein
MWPTLQRRQHLQRWRLLWQGRRRQQVLPLLLRRRGTKQLVSKDGSYYWSGQQSRMFVWDAVQPLR